MVTILLLPLDVCTKLVQKFIIGFVDPKAIEHTGFTHGKPDSCLILEAKMLITIQNHVHCLVLLNTSSLGGRSEPCGSKDL